jgi:arylsulfatase
MTTVELDHPAGPADGALMARGSLNSGFVLMVKDGRLVFDYNDFHRHTRVVSPAPLPPGPHTVELKVARAADGGGDFALAVDGVTLASAHAPRLLFMISSTGMDLGRSLSPVTADYVGVRDAPAPAARRGEGPGARGDDPTVGTPGAAAGLPKCHAIAVS